MTRDELLTLLRDIDERVIFIEGGPLAPQLKKAIAWLENEENSHFTSHGGITRDMRKVWVLR
jgi:hypothetical protein